LKLNLEKCVFDVQRGKMLGCLVSIKGIKANLDKINVIEHMKPPQSKKEVQKLRCRIVALNWFMSRLGAYHSSRCLGALITFTRDQSNSKLSMSSKNTFKSF
jgi:hypothetical protein